MLPSSNSRAEGLRSTARDGHVVWVDDATSARMAGIRQAGTKPEQVVRMLLRPSLRALGSDYRVKNRDLPGSPDLANRRHRWAIFVHGCYWHRHPGCKAASTPSRNREFWVAKFARNVERDATAIAKLRALGFRVAVIWECETKKPEALAQSLESLLRDWYGSSRMNEA